MRSWLQGYDISPSDALDAPSRAQLVLVACWRPATVLALLLVATIIILSLALTFSSTLATLLGIVIVHADRAHWCTSSVAACTFQPQVNVLSIRVVVVQLLLSVELVDTLTCESCCSNPVAPVGARIMIQQMLL